MGTQRVRDDRQVFGKVIIQIFYARYLPFVTVCR